jgi:hypothetical protein
LPISSSAEAPDQLLDLVIADILDAARRRVLVAAVPDRLQRSPEPSVKDSLSGSQSIGGRGLCRPHD